MNTNPPVLVEVKFAKINAVNIALHPAPVEDLLRALKKRLGPKLGVYTNETAILDISSWQETEIRKFKLELGTLTEVFNSAEIHWVAVKAASACLESQAEALGLRYEIYIPEPSTDLEQIEAGQQKEQLELATVEPNLDQTDCPELPAQAPAQAPSQAETENQPRRTLVIDQAVRSGQKIYAQGADLVVMGQVSAGAEVIADGNVHVYGMLRGRALAGAGGDTKAKIISTCFEAELVAIAGYYLTFEAGYPNACQGKPLFIYLDDGVEPATVRLKPINIR